LRLAVLALRFSVMTEMTMNRVIHHAVRRDFDRVAAALHALPEGDTDRAQAVGRGWDFLHSELTRHHEGEDQHVWPMLAGFGVDADLLATMESEHQAMSDALTSASVAVHRVVGTATREDADVAATAVEHARKIATEHLAHEEGDVEPQIIAHMDSPEWKTTEKQLRKASPTTAGQFFAWIQDGMSPEGRAYLDKTVPKPVTFIFSHVFGMGYHRKVAPAWR
jgi:hemerythrin-like domain-containing protein